jgi:hypothetical protein
MVTEKKWKILSDIGLDGHTKDGSILDINLIFGKLIFSKSRRLETHFPDFKWIIYDFNDNRNNTQKTISICA